MPPAVEAENLVKNFESARVIHDLSFEVQEGEVFGIVGPDGAGKTSLVRMLAGVTDPTSGSIRISGIDLSQNPESARNLIGYMPQRFSLYEDLSVRENLDFFTDMYGVPEGERKKRLDNLYRFSRLEEFQDRFAGKLSGGMQKKLALSCALINFPRILILDEPTIGVDPLSRQELWEMLFELNKQEKTTIVVTTSYMDEVKKFGRVGILHHGRFLVCDRTQKIMSGAGSFEEVFVKLIEKAHADNVFG